MPAQMPRIETLGWPEQNWKSLKAKKENEESCKREISTLSLGTNFALILPATEISARIGLQLTARIGIQLILQIESSCDTESSRSGRHAKVWASHYTGPTS